MPPTVTLNSWRDGCLLLASGKCPVEHFLVPATPPVPAWVTENVGQSP